jgi:hypothetical protein
MKVILDESTLQKLRLLIEGDHTVVTAWFQGWSGLKNGALLDAPQRQDACYIASTSPTTVSSIRLGYLNSALTLGLSLLHSTVSRRVKNFGD